jgi:hypothetical protein
MNGVKCLFVYFFLICHAFEAKNYNFGVDFEDCGEKTEDNWFFKLKVNNLGSLIEPHSVTFDSCEKVPCGIERERKILVEVEFDPNGELKNLWTEK